MLRGVLFLRLRPESRSRPALFLDSDLLRVSISSSNSSDCVTFVVLATDLKGIEVVVVAKRQHAEALLQRGRRRGLVVDDPGPRSLALERGVRVPG